MISCNQVVLTGKVATTPRRQYRPDGTPVLQFPLALNDSKDSSGQPSQNLINIVAFGKLAEIKPDLQSGQHLLVKGRLNQRRWQTPEGKNRTQTEVIAIELHTVEETETTTGLPKGKMDSIEGGKDNEKTG